MSTARLLAIVEVAPESRVLCQAPGCGHGVYKRIHVVDDGERLQVLGSDCFSRLYGHLVGEKTAPRYGSSTGHCLTAEERQMLLDNTQRFIEQLEGEHLLQMQLEQERHRAAQQEAEQRQELIRQKLHQVKQALERSRRSLPYHEWLTQLTPSQREAFDAVRRQARDAIAAKYQINADLPGFVGMVNQEALRRFQELEQGQL